jgi:class 3 adenylate cyclase
MRRIIFLFLALLPANFALGQMQGQGAGDSTLQSVQNQTADASITALRKTGTGFLNQAWDSSRPITAAARQAYADSAIRYFKLAIPSLLDRKDLNQYQATLEELSDAYVVKGDYANALDSFQKHIAYRDSLRNKENARKLNEAEMRVAVKKAEDSIRAESEKRTLQLRKDSGLAALNFESEQKQAQARTEAERRKILFDADVKRKEIETKYKMEAASMEAKQRREAALAKAEADKVMETSASETRRKKILMEATIAGSALLLIGAVISFLAYRGKRKAAIIIASEQQRNQALLHNILPATVAEELKATGTYEARQYDEVTVIFTDFVNFSGAAEKSDPEALVRELHECFSAFDRISEKHGLEKIKTIGDAYLAVCGLPEPNFRHGHAVVSAALEIRDFMLQRRKEHESFQLRIGIHTGPVVAGIVGVLKYGYDVWGETVNVAVRMEREGTPGSVNISESTCQLVKHDYPCKPRGAESQTGLQMYEVEVAGVVVVRN